MKEPTSYKLDERAMKTLENAKDILNSELLQEYYLDSERAALVAAFIQLEETINQIHETKDRLCRGE